MADNDLLIKIGADNEDVKKSLNEIETEAKSTEEALSSIALVSGAAFAALVAGAGVAIHAFAEAEATQKKLILSLQNNGVASDSLLKKYEGLAESLQNLTGVDDDAIKGGLGVLQNFLGQQEASEELVKAMLDLAEKTGSVESAAQILGRGIAGNTRGLKQFGIVIDESATKEERIAAITQQVGQRFGGLSAEMNKGLGAFRGLTTATGNFLEAIGERLAPAVTDIVVRLTAFFTKLNSNKPLLDFIVTIGTITATLLGGITAIAGTAIAIGKFTTAISIARAAITALGTASKIAVGATGLGLFLIIAGEIYANWNSIFPIMSAVFETFVGNITKLGGAFGKVLKGLFTFDTGLLKSALDDAQGVLNAGLDNIAKTSKEKKIEGPGITQGAGGAAAAAARAEEEKRVETDKQAFLKAQREQAELELGAHSQRVVDLKKEEVDILKLLEEEKDAADRERLLIKLDENRAYQEQAAQQEKDFQDQILANNSEYQALDDAQKKEFNEKNRAALIAQTENELSIKRKLANDSAQVQIQANNKYLETQAKYGTVVAELEKITQDKRVEALSAGLGAFAGLQKSKNKELQALGKAAAITQIGIDTAKGALAAYTNFLIAIPFPPVAIPLGIAAAAAVVATGAQSISDVLAAQGGGIVPGANLGGDSVPAILQPGELVVPRANFGEVVDAVATRKVQEDADVGGPGASGGGQVSVLIGFDGPEAEKVLTYRQKESRILGTFRG